MLPKPALHIVRNRSLTSPEPPSPSTPPPRRLEPILHRIATKRNSVVCPHISSISADTMYFAGGGRSRAVGGFSWAMHFTWDYKPDNGLPDTEPLPLAFGEGLEEDGKGKADKGTLRDGEAKRVGLMRRG